ncbi:MAG: XisI protein [Cyanobacteria bacterium P01_F01_bin.150]
MDKLDKYRQIIQELMSEYSSYQSQNSDIEQELIGDTQHDRYLLLNLGWDNGHRIYNCFIHIELRNEKIWIQRNMTDVDFAEELVEMGVEKTDIVLGFHSPFKRQFTEYAVS